jgi:uncharacterized protein (DUF2235 family)
MTKTVIFCADGTWNGPGQDGETDQDCDATNVYKLFVGLAGAPTTDSLRKAEEQEKALHQGADLVQVAKYIHGVGDSRNPIIRLMGGIFGSGTISRIVRGYTFISRNYDPGDDIVVVGFSRGAYTARALVGLIASQGLLAKRLTTDQEQAYRFGSKAWYRFRTAVRAPYLQEVADALPAFLSRNDLHADDLVPVQTIRAVAVWDTVGALGIPTYVGGSRMDAFRFADTKLSALVDTGLHAVALDEQRVDFTPTLWEPASNVLQMVFPGAHADVGGGYPTRDHESGLSDIALQWMADQLTTVGVRFSQPLYCPFAPEVRGTAHKPWLSLAFRAGLKGHRQFKGTGISAHPSIAQRIAAGPVLAAPGEAAAPYAPVNWP